MEDIMSAVSMPWLQCAARRESGAVYVKRYIHHVSASSPVKNWPRLAPFMLYASKSVGYHS